MADAFVRSLRGKGPRPALLAALTGGVALAGFSVSGCANLPKYPFSQPPVDVTSPLAEDLRKVNPTNAAYPTFRQVPDMPTDLRPATAWTRNIYNTLRLRRQMQALQVLYPQTLYGTEAFAQVERNQAAAPLTPAQAAANADKTAAFAKQQRDRAKAPSPAL